MHRLEDSNRLRTVDRSLNLDGCRPISILGFFVDLVSKSVFRFSRSFVHQMNSNVLHIESERTTNELGSVDLWPDSAAYEEGLAVAVSQRSFHRTRVSSF